MAEAATISSDKQDRSPAPAGPSGGAVQLLPAEQKQAAAAVSSNWFSPLEPPPDSGEIESHHTLFALLHRIYSARLTGKLQLVFGRVEKALFFDGGHLVFASSSDSQDGLGEVMLRAGALTQSQFEEASALVETGQRFGSAIAEMGIYGVQEIVGWVRRQVIQVVASVLDFPAGRYFFFSSLEKNAVPEIGTPVPLGKLLLEAVRKASDLPLDRLAEVADLHLELSSDPLRLFKEVQLEDRERKLLGQVAQRISAKDIVAQSGLPRPEASRALYALLLLGSVVGVRDGIKPGGATSAADPVAPTPLGALEEPKALEAPSAANIPQQPSVEAPERPQAATALEASAATILESQPASPLAAPPATPAAHSQPVEAAAQAHQVKASAPPDAANTPEHRPADVHAEKITTSESASRDTVAHTQPQLEEIPRGPEVPKETEPPPVTPLPLLKSNMIARDVSLRATGISSQKNAPEHQLFNEETAAVLVAETGGVIRLSATVVPGQLLVLANLETKCEVIVQVARKRAYQPTVYYLELEFVEPARRFWGTEFSAATALLPKNTRDAETAAMVITAPATADQPWVLPPAPSAEEVRTFQRDLAELRGTAISTDPPPASAQAAAMAHLSSEVSAAAPIPASVDPLSTEAILESGLDAAGAAAPIKREPALPAPWESGAPSETPQPISDFINSLPKSKRWRLPRGGFTPEFSRVVLLTVILLVVLGIGTTWFKHWLPWQSAGSASKKHAARDNMRVASDAPVTSEGITANSAAVSNAGASAPAEGIDALAGASSSNAPAGQPASKKNASSKAPAAKPSSVRPAAKSPSNSNATSGKDVVVPPKLLHSEQAVASLEALRDFERGNVVIDAVVGTSGEVHFISVLSGPPSLRDPAVESLKQYKYEPATRNGQPVPAHVTITIHFRFEP